MTVPIRIAVIQDSAVERVVLVVEQGAVFLDDLLPAAPTDVRSLIAQWPRWCDALKSGVAEAAPITWEVLGDVRWCPPVRPAKLLCVGANYYDHLSEMGGASDAARAPFPFSFLKPLTTLAGSGSQVRHPSYGRLLDWEAELAVVIGDPSGRSDGAPRGAVFGYTILNDLSLRDYYPFPHSLGMDAVVSKGFDGAAPMGPWITLAEDVPDPQDLPITLAVNGEVMQNGSTGNMVFSIDELLEHYARILSLEPGDVIATGTPAGVGAAHRPPRFLAPGDVCEVRIGGLGCLTTHIGEPVDGKLLEMVESNE